jgi:hypothetical protein
MIRHLRNVQSSDLQKLEKIRQIRKSIHSETVSTLSIDTSNEEDKEKDYKLVKNQRDRVKNMTIVHHLRQMITTQHVIRPTFGEAFFFMMAFSNPYSKEHTFTIDYMDHELRLAHQEGEVEYLKRTNQVHAKFDPRIFVSVGDSRSSIHLLPSETFYIPFVFQSFQKEEIAPRTIEIEVLNQSGIPMEILQLKVHPRHCYIDKKVIYHCPEANVFKKSMEIMASSDAANTYLAFDPEHPYKKHVKVLDHDVICSFKEDLVYFYCIDELEWNGEFDLAIVSS